VSRKSEAAITRLLAQKLAELMSWLEEHHAQVWDKQTEDDLEAGRFNNLLAEIDGEHEAVHGKLAMCAALEYLEGRAARGSQEAYARVLA